MFKLKWGILILFVFIFVAEFHGGETRKCIVCKSTDNENCASAPTEVETSECDSTTAVPPASTTTTAAPPAATTTTVAPPATTTTTGAPPATTTTTGAPPATTTTTAAPSTATPTTEVSSETTPTTGASPATTPTTGAPPATTPTTAAPSTAAPTTAAPSTAAPTTEVSSETTPTTEVPPATTPTTAAPSTATPTTEVSSGTPTAPGGLAANELSGSNNITPGSQNNQKIPQAIQINRRSRRQAGPSVLAESSSQCYKIVYQAGETEVVERGCTQTTCDALKAGKGDVSFCEVCNEDGCNSSSMIITNITLILLLLGITFHLTQ